MIAAVRVAGTIIAAVGALFVAAQVLGGTPFADLRQLVARLFR